jgi:predicted amidohydrolase
MSLNVALIQMQAGPDITANLHDAGRQIREAAANGAQLIVTPENTCHIITPSTRKLETAGGEDDHQGISFFSDLARELKIWLIVGSMAVKVKGNKLANRQFVFGPDGSLKTTYDKIHLFDVDLPTGERHRESDLMQPGNRAVIAKTDLANIGLSICYDLRFPQLYNALANNGAQIIVIPSAFTVPTGKAHWHVLMRARAIETGCFVLAAAQVGEHDGGRKTYGHSLIINPWGEIIAEGDDAPGIISAKIDLEEVVKARSAIPNLQHSRDFKVEIA